jgi:hypothetical protein
LTWNAPDYGARLLIPFIRLHTAVVGFFQAAGTGADSQKAAHKELVALVS